MHPSADPNILKPRTNPFVRDAKCDASPAQSYLRTIYSMVEFILASTWFEEQGVFLSYFDL